MCSVGVQTIFAVSTEWDKNIQLATYTCDTALEGWLVSLYRSNPLIGARRYGQDMAVAVPFRNVES